MQIIPLTKGKVALVDDEDYERMILHKWHAHRSGSAYYARTNLRIENVWRTVYMHRLLLGISDDPAIQADHRNHNTLDNRRLNLRIASRAQNQQNRRSLRVTASGFKGVYMTNKRKPFQARITVNGKRRSVGYFMTALEAARAYDAKAIELCGEYACLNFPDDATKAINSGGC